MSPCVRHGRRKLASRRARGARGFTLIELMVAMGLSAVVAVGLYSLSMVASQTFQQQQRVAEIQQRLRSAIEMVRGDMQRAGYMGTPSSDVDPRVCPRPNAVVQAVELRNSTVPLHLPAQNTFINPVELRLTGNYQSTDSYYVQYISGTTVFLQHRRPEYADRIPDAFTFNQIFNNRMIRVAAPDGSMQFAMVTSTNYVPPTTASSYPSLTVGTPLVMLGSAAGGGGSAGCGLPALCTGCIVAPVTTVVYRLDVPSNISAWAPTAYSGSAVTQTGRMDLIREEYNNTAAGLTLVAGSQRIVAEYAVDFDAAAVVDQAAIGLGEPLLVRLGFGDPRNRIMLGAAAGGGGAMPERARSLLVRLSVRDRVQDPEFGWAPRMNNQEPLTRYRVFNGQNGAARVRTVTTEMALPNVAFRNLRPR